jgi:hypothetical protein
MAASGKQGGDGMSDDPTATAGAYRLAPTVGAFVAGFVAVLVAHQPALEVLHLFGLTPNLPYELRPTAPLGVPQFLSSAFWGGVWGIPLMLLLAVVPRGWRRWLVALLFGAFALTLVARFIVLPLKGVPVAGGLFSVGFAIGLIVNGAWGLGTALLSLLLPPQARFGQRR